MMERSAQQQQEQVQRSQYVNNVVGNYHQQAEQFKKQEPSFGEAYDFLTQGRTQQYMEAGYPADQAAAMVQQEEFSIVEQAQRMGLNPAVMVYNMAQTYGWKPTAKESAKMEKDLSAIQQGMKQNKSLASAKGKGVDPNVTLEAIAEMSDEDFNKFWSSMKDS